MPLINLIPACIGIGYKLRKPVLDAQRFGLGAAWKFFLRNGGQVGGREFFYNSIPRAGYRKDLILRIRNEKQPQLMGICLCSVVFEKKR